VRSGPGEARTILLLHIISVRPSKQLLMVRRVPFLHLKRHAIRSDVPPLVVIRNLPSLLC
jgi:hypothetical protein